MKNLGAFVKTFLTLVSFQYRQAELCNSFEWDGMHFKQYQKLLSL